MNKDDQVREFVMEITNNQINDNNPPITRQTFKRLVTDGFSEEDAKGLISQIVWAEVYVVIKEKRVFDLERFSAALNYLPNMPWSDE